MAQFRSTHRIMAEESLKKGWDLAKAEGPLPSITFDGASRKKVVVDDLEGHQWTYNHPSIGQVLATAIAPRQGDHGLTTKVEAYVGPPEDGGGRLSALCPKLSFPCIELGGRPDKDGDQTHGGESDGLQDGATKHSALWGTWEISKGVTGIAVHVKILPECVSENDSADFRALVAASTGTLNFRPESGLPLLRAVLCPSAAATEQQAKLSEIYTESITATEMASRSCFPLTGLLHGHINFSPEGRDPSKTRLVEIPCKALISFGPPTTTADDVPDLLDSSSDEGGSDDSDGEDEV